MPSYSFWHIIFVGKDIEIFVVSQTVQQPTAVYSKPTIGSHLHLHADSP